MTFALTPEQDLAVTHAETFASEVRLALLRPGDSQELTAKQRKYTPHAMSHRLLLAIGDDALASSAAALAAEGEELEVVDRVADPEDLTRALRRLDLDVVVLHDELGGVAPLELARELAAGFPDVGVVLIAAERVAGRCCAPRCRRASATSCRCRCRSSSSRPACAPARCGRARCATAWPERRPPPACSAASSSPWPAPRAASARRRSRCTWRSPRRGARPGRPVCVVDFDLQKGDFRTLLDTPYRRSVVDLVEVAGELSVRHLQETLYTHPLGVRVLLAPNEGERAEEVDAAVARSVLTAVKARHALTVVDLGATVSEASAVGAEIANKVLVVTTPDVLALRGVRRLRELWSRLQVRADDEEVYVVLNRASRRREIQPDLARKVVGGRMAETAHAGRLRGVRGGGQHRRAGPHGGGQAARRRSSRWSRELDIMPASSASSQTAASRAACSAG